MHLHTLGVRVRDGPSRSLRVARARPRVTLALVCYRSFNCLCKYYSKGTSSFDPGPRLIFVFYISGVRDERGDIRNRNLSQYVEDLWATEVESTGLAE
ncbi:hypothetical protein EVAR_870_1 [Eumeta japonica]|uniref:Uncharacterized protein n=1 Tax=Eumeta variegata TaxID=151549 RepID=A0A4C1SDM0_EUMVA|nr:hypothetical protein EVAR_870_1 [Eumeta japonica]